MAETTLQLGFVPKNRGEYQSTPVTRYYKDNVVQYNGSSYIADPVGWSESDPTATYVTIAPTDASGNLNAGWRVFASGNNTFTTGEKVDNVGIDSEPTADSNNLVISGGVYDKIVSDVFDVSKEFPTRGYEGTDMYPDFYAACAVIPNKYRNIGLLMKYKNTSGNYVLFWYLGGYNDSFTNIRNWVYIARSSPITSDSDSPIASSIWVNRRAMALINYLQTSCLAFGNINKFKGRVDVANGKITSTTYEYSSARDTFCVYPVASTDIIQIQGQATNGTAIALLSDFDFNYGVGTDGYSLSFATGETGVRTITSKTTLTIPNNTKYLLVTSYISTANNTPKLFDINGRNMLKDLREQSIFTFAQSLSSSEKAQAQSNIGIEVESTPTEESTKLITSGGVYNAISEVNENISEQESKLDGTYKITLSGTATQGTYIQNLAFSDKYYGHKMKIKLTCANNMLTNYQILSQNGINICGTIDEMAAFYPNEEYIVYFTNDTDIEGKTWGLYTSANKVLASGDYTLEIWPYYYNSLDYLASEKTFNDDDKVTTNHIVFNELVQETSGYNVSAKFPTGGVDGGNTYTLNGAIATVPAGRRVEGMTITFIDSESGDWVQWRKKYTGTFTDTSKWERTGNVQVTAYKHPFDGKKLITLCDSLGSSSKWQERLVQLTNAVYDAQKNNNHYSYGGTQTLNGSNYCGQARAKMLVDEGLITPDVIIIENVNDSAAPAGNITDEPFFMHSRKQLSVPIQSSAADAETYWTTNFATVVGGETPAVGSVLGIPYAISNAIKLTITHVPTSNGNVDIRLSGMSETQAISVVTTDTIQDILDKILEYQWYDYTVKQDGDDSVIFSPMSTGEKTITISYHSTGVTGTTLIGQSGTNYIWKYFYSFDVNDWNTAAKWVGSISRIAAWKGLVEYLFTNFPNTLIYWLIPKSYNFDYTSAEWHRADGSIDYDKVVTQKNYAASTFTAQINFCDRYQIPYIDIRNEACITPANIATFIKPSNVHPKDDGYTRWGDVIAKMTS